MKYLIGLVSLFLIFGSNDDFKPSRNCCWVKAWNSLAMAEEVKNTKGPSNNNCSKLSEDILDQGKAGGEALAGSKAPTTNKALVQNSKLKTSNYCLTGPNYPVTRHFAEATICTKCHVGKKQEQDFGPPFRMLTGDLTFSIPQLCGQCHGIVKRDWDRGIHGKTFGGWKKASPISCVQCHNPHAPEFRQMSAQKPPSRPRFGIHKKGDTHDEQ